MTILQPLKIPHLITRKFLSLTQSTTTSLTERRLIGFSAKQMYNIVANVQEYRKFVPWVIDSQIIRMERYNDKSNTEAQLTVGFQSIHESYISKVNSIENKSVEANASQSKLFNLLKNKWIFHPAPKVPIPHHHHLMKQYELLDNQTPDDYPCCYVDFHVEFQFKSLLHAQLSDLFFEKSVKMMVLAFENRAKELYGTPSRPSVKVPIPKKLKF